MTDSLIARLEAAAEGSRELDLAIAYHVGLGNEKERRLYSEMGDAAFVPDARGISPYGKARGDTVRSERVAGKRNRYEDVIWRACDGPSPLLRCPRFTTDLQCALTLVPEGWVWLVSNRAPAPHTGRAYLHNGKMHMSNRYRGVEDTAATPALALCISALRARSRS